MNARTLRRLAAVLAALVVVWLGLSALAHARRDTAGHLALPRFDPKTVDLALLAHGPDTLRFTRSVAGWVVNGYRADRSLVRDLVGALADSSLTSEIVGENAATHAQLGLDSSHARRLVLYQGTRAVANLLLGRSTYRSLYARRPGENTSYELTGRLTDLVDKPLDGWRDHRIADVPPDSVTQVLVSRGRTRYTLTRGGGAWRLGAAAADTGAVKELLDRFHALDADGFATAAQADTLRRSGAGAERTVRLLATGDRPLLALSIDSTRGGVWARREGDSTVYRLDNWIANQLTPADSTLRRKAGKRKSGT